MLLAASPLPEFAARELLSGRQVPVGMATDSLPEVPPELDRYRSRNSQLLMAAYSQIAEAVEEAARDHGRDRIAVVLGSSASGIEEGERAMVHRLEHGSMPERYHLSQQELGAPALFLAEFADLRGVAYTISTACSSSAKALACARGLIELDLFDAVVCGGSESFSAMTLNGFDSLGLVSDERCNPSSVNRRGLNLGEGAALFLMRAQSGGIQLLGVGETCDASHFSAPDPDAAGAVACMRMALRDAATAPEEIDYINLHGTATPQNDAMEARAVHEVFRACDGAGPGSLPPPASSTKPLTGHTLGAAGAIEAGICWLALSAGASGLPAHRYDGEYDAEIAAITLVTTDGSTAARTALTNSFGFGGSNCSLVLQAVS